MSLTLILYFMKKRGWIYLIVLKYISLFHLKDYSVSCIGISGTVHDQQKPKPNKKLKKLRVKVEADPQ